MGPYPITNQPEVKCLKPPCATSLTITFAGRAPRIQAYTVLSSTHSFAKISESKVIITLGMHVFFFLFSIPAKLF